MSYINFSSGLSKSLLITIVTMMTMTLSVKAENAYSVLEKDIERIARTHDLPALAIQIVDSEGPIWSYGYGEVAGKGTPVDHRTLFRVGSVTKLFTDMALMQLVEEGVVQLDKPVTEYLPEFSPQNPFNVDITVEMLLTHRSGLVREPPTGNYFDTSEPALNDVVSSLNQTRLVYAPGSKVQYSNAALAVVGRIVEVMRETAFHEVISQKLMAPLNMQDSHAKLTTANLKDVPEGYMRRYHAGRFIAPNFELGIAPAGSMLASMHDLGKLATALINEGKASNGQILSRETLRKMWTPLDDSASARDHQFGLGFILSNHEGELAVSHGGAVYGFATQFIVLPQSGIGVAISTNVDFGNGVVNRIADHALSYSIAIQRGEQPNDVLHTYPIDKKLSRKLAGYYQRDDSSVTVVERNDNLFIERLGGLSLKLMNSKEGIVIDDLVKFSRDIKFDPQGVTVFGQQFSKVKRNKPDIPVAEFAYLIGEYGEDHNILYILEKDGVLHAVIEWMAEYPLTQIDESTFAFPDYGLYPGEHLTFVSSGAEHVAKAVNLGGIKFDRRSGSNGHSHPEHTPAMQMTLSTLFEAAKESQALQLIDRKISQSEDPELVDITGLSKTIKLDIKYATTDNVFGFQVYPQAKAYLHSEAAQALVNVHNRLKSYGLGLVVFDAYRPWYVTRFFWEITPEEKRIFVANPSIGSRHNRGSAVDASLYDLRTGKTVSMVSDYDEMTERSFPHYLGGNSLQRWYRELLIKEMAVSGFEVHENEWWHFDYEQWEQFPLINIPFEDL